MQETLEKIGAHQQLLSPEEKKFLDDNGYLNLGKLLSDDQLKQIRLKTRKLLELEGEKAGSELEQSVNIRHSKETGAHRLADLVNKGEEFDLFYTQPRVLAAISQVLGNDFKLSSLNYRAALPGAGLQKLHADWPVAVDKGKYQVCNSIWLLDDFTTENGATRIVPGTHLQNKLPQDLMENPMDPHPEEVLIEAPAGSVFIFNSHTWHGGTTNRSEAPRRAIHSYFCRRDQIQQTDQKKYIKTDTLQRISREAAFILGLD
ncbi:Ectoine hydroxylase-related dioxygenase, phytanoyl-CoA dioxygenase (PhyH) family [Cyclobacterium lianum]|uniref:Ectoine hydroxylase-related dioxygenase, phytanoyl-CoA dioxygenase (PhyH) family n=1 Tax=Cyclobacterium lianum TaxID=388280 RepID=A0A1M7QES4_9BACT|nr:phytanoyl-CoA dioxygenase family protein [Cyclobacterium lianum]SHN29377.1 Ectoine hydroxylase-related dioxygenase, phytanoyl-CoA dioxygenase (PhyH) family [Cyclobacterium lianum]